MAFGRSSRKQEGRSPRPLSMIITDNVWPFGKKGRQAMGKALDQQGTRLIDNGKANRRQSTLTVPSETVSDPVPLPASDRRGSLRDTATLSSQSTQATRAVSSGSTTSQSSQKVSVDLGKDSESEPAKPAAPFLTLNLGESTTSLGLSTLGVPQKYLEREVSPGSLASTDYEHERTHTRNEPSTDITSSSSASSGQSSPAEAQTPTTTLMETPWAVSSRDIPIVPQISMAELDMGDTSSSSVSSRQPSTSSCDWASPHGSTDSFLLDDTRKVMVNRGVYIFDPAHGGDPMMAQLSADESFNPFDFA